MSRDIPDPSKPLSVYPTEKEALSVPKRCGMKRRECSQEWDRKFSDHESLDEEKDRVAKELREARKRMKRYVSMDADYWDQYHNVAVLTQENAQIESQRGLESVLKAKKAASKWYNSDEGQRLQQQYTSWKQAGDTIKRQQEKTDNRKSTFRKGWLKLFITSKIGMGLVSKDTGLGPRDTSDQSNFKKALINTYSTCSVRIAEVGLWEPVVGDWYETLQGAHLFPYAQGQFMDDIFGKGAHEELFSPKNGLLLHRNVKHALEKGFAMIVPDVDLEPADPDFPLRDKQERDNRLKAWKRAKTKEYKFIVPDEKQPAVNEKFYSPKGEPITIAELNGKRLEFLSNSRPRARYVWWTFFNAVLRRSWSQKLTEGNMQHKEVQKRTLYWGSDGSYIKKSQILGCIEEIGHDVEIESSGEESYVKPKMEGVGAVLGQALLESHEEEERVWVDMGEFEKDPEESEDEEESVDEEEAEDEEDDEL